MINIHICTYHEVSGPKISVITENVFLGKTKVNFQLSEPIIKYRNFLDTFDNYVINLRFYFLV